MKTRDSQSSDVIIIGGGAREPGLPATVPARLQRDFG